MILTKDRFARVEICSRQIGDLVQGAREASMQRSNNRHRLCKKPNEPMNDIYLAS